MKAIEIKTKTDKTGHLKVNIPLKEKNKKVKILILFNEEDEICDENLWLYANSKNPSFNFLNEPEEDVYTINDGKPLTNDKK